MRNELSDEEEVDGDGEGECMCGNEEARSQMGLAGTFWIRLELRGARVKQERCGSRDYEER